jgi:hypothetical protein
MAFKIHLLYSCLKQLVHEQLETLKGIAVEALATRLAKTPKRTLTSECIIHNLKLCLPQQELKKINI